MSTPVDLNIVMPYGATVVGAGSRIPLITGPAPNKRDAAALNLTPGPCRIAASWSGPDALDICVMTEGAAAATVVGQIPAGGGTTFDDGSLRGDSKTVGLSAGRLRREARSRCHRHHRGLPDGVHRVAHRAGAVA